MLTPGAPSVSNTRDQDSPNRSALYAAADANAACAQLQSIGIFRKNAIPSASRPPSRRGTSIPFLDERRGQADRRLVPQSTAALTVSLRGRRCRTPPAARAGLECNAGSRVPSMPARPRASRERSPRRRGRAARRAGVEHPVAAIRLGLPTIHLADHIEGDIVACRPKHRRSRRATDRVLSRESPDRRKSRGR